ncbi:hypothetical protein SSTU70S_05725 [Stutzerimonas stutzeri]
MVGSSTPRNASYLLAAMLIFLCAPVFAEDLPKVIAQVTGTDYSDDFGQKVLNWISFGTDTPTWGNKSLLSVISLYMNGIALIVMAWLAIIGGTNFVIQTANKGVPGGQVISSFWMPIRVGVATILLIPLSSGYSTLQYGVMTIAEKGNQHGNVVMAAGLDYLYDFGVYRSPALEDGGGIIFSWIESEVCRQYINSYTKDETIVAVPTQVTQRSKIVSKIAYSYKEEETWFWRNDPRTDYCGAVSFSVDAPDANLNNWGDTHTAAYGGPTEIASQQLQLLQDIQPKIAEIAGLILSDEGALRDLQASGESAQSKYEQAVAGIHEKLEGAAGKYLSALAAYNSGTQKAVAQAVNKINDDKNERKTFWGDKSDNKGWKEQTLEIGWPALGTIFWQINVNQGEINKLAATMSATYTDPQLDEEWLKDQRLGEVSSRIRGLKKAVAPQRATIDNRDGIPSLSAIADAGSEGEGWMDNIKSTIYEFFGGIMKNMMYANSPDDLVLNLQYFGSAAGTAAEAGWWAKTLVVSAAQAALTTGGEVADTVNSFAWYNPVGWVAKAIAPGAKGAMAGIARFIDSIDGLVNYLLLGLIMVGFTLGIVLPAIPLTIWFMGVVSWMLFFIECLLVSPMWLAAHGTAEREGWGSEHTRQGYMLMIGLYLNPILRVAGFFAIFLALKPAAYLVSWFIDYVNGVVVTGFALFFYYFGAMAVITIFAYSLLVRVFGLPSEIFERGLRWINGGQEVTGDGSSEEKTRNNFAMFSSKSENAALGRTTGSRLRDPTRDGPGKDNDGGSPSSRPES